MYICSIVTKTSADVKLCPPHVVKIHNTWKEAERYAKQQLNRRYKLGAVIELHKCDKTADNIDPFTFRVCTLTPDGVTIQTRHSVKSVFALDSQTKEILLDIFMYGEASPCVIYRNKNTLALRDYLLLEDAEDELKEQGAYEDEIMEISTLFGALEAHIVCQNYINSIMAPHPSVVITCCRLVARYSQIQLADMLNMHINGFARYERGTRCPSISRILLIAKLCNIDRTLFIDRLLDYYETLDE